MIALLVALLLPAVALAGDGLPSFRFVATSSTETRYSGRSGFSTDPLAVAFPMVGAGNARGLTVTCDAAITSGTMTFTLVRGGTPTTTSVACTLGDAPTPTGGTSWCTITGEAVELSDAELLSVRVVPSSPSATPICFGYLWTGATILAGGGDSATSAPQNGWLCDFRDGFCSAGGALNTASTGATITGCGVHLSSGATNGDEQYEAYNVTQAVSIGCAPTVADSATTATVTSCSSNCTPAAGDILAFRYIDAGNTGVNVQRSFTLRFTPGNAIIEAGGGSAWNAAETRYSALDVAWNATQSLSAARLPFAGWLKRLHVGATATMTNGTTVTACSGDTSSPSCGDVSCTVAASGRTCSDTTSSSSRRVAATEFVQVSASNPAETGFRINAAMEIERRRRVIITDFPEQ